MSSPHESRSSLFLLWLLHAKPSFTHHARQWQHSMQRLPCKPVFLHAGVFQIACAACTKMATCSQAAPDNWEAFWELSQARFELGDAAGGLLPLDRASALTPGNDEVALTLAEVRRLAISCTLSVRWILCHGKGRTRGVRVRLLSGCWGLHLGA